MGAAAVAFDCSTFGRRDQGRSSHGAWGGPDSQAAERGGGPSMGESGATRGKRVEGWDSIADLVGMSPSWCQRASREGRVHRLPVRYLGRQPGQRQGLPVLYLVDLDSWLDEAP